MDRATGTLDHRGDDASACRANGWAAGTRLVGDEGYGPTIIEITAVGEHNILAKRLAHAGRAVRDDESSWVLYCRDWHEFVGEVPAPVPAGTTVVVTALPGHPRGTIRSGPDHGGMYRILMPDDKLAITVDFTVPE